MERRSLFRGSNSSGPSPLAIVAMVVASVALAVAAVALSFGIKDVRQDPTRYEWTITLDVQQYVPPEEAIDFIGLYQGARLSLDQPFNATLKVTVSVDERDISIVVPELAFDCTDPETGDAFPCYLHTVGGFLPAGVRPNGVRPLVFYAGGWMSGGYQLSFRPDGSLVLSGLDGGPIRPQESAQYGSGGQRVQPTVVGWSVEPENWPPRNVRLSDTPTTSFGTTEEHDQNELADYYLNDIRTDPETGETVVAFSWACLNPNAADEPVGHRSLSFCTRTGTVVAENGPGRAATVRWNPVRRALVSDSGAVCLEGGIVINPTDVDNLIVFSICFNRTVPKPGATRTGIFVASSTDRGQTWSERLQLVDYVHGGFDPWATFDSYGNLWLSSGVQPVHAYSSEHNRIPIFLSTDGGQSFTEAARIQGSDQAHILDFGKIAIGPDGSGVDGQLALWILYDNASFSDGRLTEHVGYMTVTGLGAYDASPLAPITGFTAMPNLPPTYAAAAVEGNILVDENGHLLMTQNDFFFCGNDAIGDGETLLFYVNRNGTGNFGTKSFSSPSVALRDTNTVGDYTAVGRLVPWSPTRGIYFAGDRTMGRDPARGRTYVLGWDIRPNEGNSSTLFVIWTENEGRTWSQPFYVNDYADGLRGMSSLAVDPVTGIIAVSYYDPRNYLDGLESLSLDSQQAVDLYAAVFSAPAA